MSLPCDSLDEVEMELAAARRSFTRDCTRTAALEELHRLARAATHEFGRPIIVFDFIRAAAARHEREPRRALFSKCAQTAAEARDHAQIAHAAP